MKEYHHLRMVNVGKGQFDLRISVALVTFHALIAVHNCSSAPHVIPAQRVCKPGPLFPAPGRGKNCLIIGDSISIGYARFVDDSLENVCQVQHAPFDFSYGGALDTSYGVNCLRIWLKTLAQDSTRYDAIIFNFGLHDVCCFIGPTEEFVSPANYHKNLGIVKNTLLNTGSAVGYVLTTPVPFSKSKNLEVIRYNKIAQTVMAKKPKVPVLDLYKKVVKRCGVPPYNNCSISLKGFKNVHYNKFGSKYLGHAVSNFLKSLLHRQKQPVLKTQHVMLETQTSKNKPAVNCTNESGKTVGVCPVGTTCSPQAHSVTGFGCCLFPDAVLCNDSYHCCPRDWTCDPLCRQKQCHCQLIKRKQKNNQLLFRI